MAMDLKKTGHAAFVYVVGQIYYSPRNPDVYFLIIANTRFMVHTICLNDMQESNWSPHDFFDDIML